METRSDPSFANLRIARLRDLLLHEDHDPARLERLKRSISSDGVQANPVIVSPVSEGRFLILDGAHRVHSLQELECSLALVQVVEAPPEPESWSHIVPGMNPDSPKAGSLTISPEGEWVSTLRRNGSPDIHLYASGEGLGGLVAGLRDISNLYPKGTSVTRTENHDGVGAETGSAEPGSGEVRVSYRAFSVPELVEVVERGEVLPAGITRFRIPERVLGVRFPLEFLRPDEPEAAAARLEDTIRRSIRENRVRRYEEPVVLFE